MLAGKISRGRQSSAGPKPPFEDGVAQFSVQPACEGLVPGAAIERELEGANGFGHGFPLGLMIFAQNGSIQCTNAA